MEALFQVQTPEHCAIMNWLVGKGITSGDIDHVELLDGRAIRITNSEGQPMTFVFDSKYGVRVKSTLVLDVNKTKLVRLVRAKGMSPPRTACFSKAFRSRGWWLEWVDSEGASCRVYLSVFMGRPTLGVTAGQQWSCHTLTLGELQKCRLLQIKEAKKNEPSR